MPLFRKKPVVVEAFHFDGTATDAAIIMAWMGMHGASAGGYGASRCLTIQTLEGEMTASPGDWVIMDVSGEFYPCKPDIFEATYESASEERT